MTVRVYLSGPMTGRPDLNFPAFTAAATQLRAAGFEVVNPAELVTTPGTPYGECMRIDIAALVTCQALAQLPDWSESRGAGVEFAVARAIGMRVGSVDDFLKASSPVDLTVDGSAPAPARAGAGVLSSDE